MPWRPAPSGSWRRRPPRWPRAPPRASSSPGASWETTSPPPSSPARSCLNGHTARAAQYGFHPEAFYPLAIFLLWLGLLARRPGLVAAGVLLAISRQGGCPARAARVRRRRGALPPAIPAAAAVAAAARRPFSSRAGSSCRTSREAPPTVRGTGPTGRAGVTRCRRPPSGCCAIPSALAARAGALGDPPPARTAALSAPRRARGARRPPSRARPLRGRGLPSAARLRALLLAPRPALPVRRGGLRPARRLARTLPTPPDRRAPGAGGVRLRRRRLHVPASEPRAPATSAPRSPRSARGPSGPGTLYPARGIAAQRRACSTQALARAPGRVVLLDSRSEPLPVHRRRDGRS